MNQAKEMRAQILRLRSGAWYGDQLIELETPPNWEVNVLWPQTPSPLKEDRIAEILQKPSGQEPIKLLCRGKSHPLIIVDDLTRPTPVEPIVQILLKYFDDANIPLRDVTILMATGAHGQPAQDAVRRKVGDKAAESCLTLVHDCFNTVRMGKTSWGTPIHVNSAVLRSDFIVGIGGVYPNHFAGFGGGTKLALGVLGIQSILKLHSFHKGTPWGSPYDTTFRSDLNEIAQTIGLHTVISLQIDSDRRIIHIDSGDPAEYYPKARDFARKTFETPFCKDADIVISNTYPIDLSLTFVQDKGFAPFFGCKSDASRIAIASCHEGAGLHYVFPFLNTRSRSMSWQQLFRFYRANGPVSLSKSIRSFVKRKICTDAALSPSAEKGLDRHPIWLYQPGEQKTKLPENIPGIIPSLQWSGILHSIEKEQGNREHLKVTVYPCAPLQSINRQL